MDLYDMYYIRLYVYERERERESVRSYSRVKGSVLNSYNPESSSYCWKVSGTTYSFVNGDQ